MELYIPEIFNFYQVELLEKDKPKEVYKRLEETFSLVDGVEIVYLGGLYNFRISGFKHSILIVIKDKTNKFLNLYIRDSLKNQALNYLNVSTIAEDELYRIKNEVSYDCEVLKRKYFTV